MTHKTDILVIGSGPGGYTAAFRAADLGKEVTLVNNTATLGGVCLNAGCIPSKYYLHNAKIISDALNAGANGIEFSLPKINFETLCNEKNKIVSNLNQGLNYLAKRRKIKIINATASFISPTEVMLDDGSTIKFNHAVIATGSKNKTLNFLPKHPRIINSEEALNLKYHHGSMLIIGAGIIGLEMATIYNTFGVQVTLVDISDKLLPFLDSDIVAPLYKKLTAQNVKILLNTTIKNITPFADFINATIMQNKICREEKFDFVLVALGREPNTQNLNLENIDVRVNEQGFIIINEKLTTNIKNIFAVGDVTPGPMLAHKASAQGAIAAEIIANFSCTFALNNIPAVCYTHPEIAWIGLTEDTARSKNINYQATKFPWLANGKAHATNAASGLTKLIFNKDNNVILGAQIIGDNAGDLISEITLAIKNNLTAAEIISAIHPHPTLSETILMAAQMYTKTATDI